MDFLWRINSRHVLAVCTAGLLAAGFGGACAAQDDSGAVTQAGYQGAYLDWSGKKPAPQTAPASPAQDDAADLTEARYAPAPDYDPGRYASTPRRSAQPAVDASESRYAPGPSAPAPAPRYAPPPPAAYVAPARYAAPRQPAQAAAAQAAPAPSPAPVQAAAQAPAQPANIFAEPATPAPSAEHAEGTIGGRFYSVDRDYGLKPDPIPRPSGEHTVLIAPDPATAANDRDQGDDEQGGVAGDGKASAHGDKAGDSQGGDN